MTAMMEPLVDTLIEDPRWQALDLSSLAEAAGRAALAGVGLQPVGYEISLLGCDDRRIAALNTDFRGKPQPTNVLSWPSEERGAATDGARPPAPGRGANEDPEELGDIAIAWETCEREALDQGKTMRDHVTHLLVHGTLHLLGYDHMEPEEEKEMFAKQKEILELAGIPRA